MNLGEVAWKLVVLLGLGIWAVLIDAYTGHLTPTYIPRPSYIDVAGLTFVWTPGAVFIALAGLLLFRKQWATLIGWPTNSGDPNE